MVVKKKIKLAKKNVKDGGVSLDDAFADDEDVNYAQSKLKKKKGLSEDELDGELDGIEEKYESVQQGTYTMSASKPISQLKRGDKIDIDGVIYDIDAHYVLINHESTKEMAIEIFNSKNEKDYQLRYFDDQVATTIEFYELQEIMYIKKPFSKISW
ncbi:hypothetical protein J4461_04245 [Candidatus Pacearchaeota archaeon]|nr:hypothetical protein [Candidatus Pacearchaeota archaeon]